MENKFKLEKNSNRKWKKFGEKRQFTKCKIYQNKN